MSFKKELQRLIKNLESFDLEVFFHDDTFLEILQDREILADRFEELSEKEKGDLYAIDEIINGYYRIYSQKQLSGYARMSFELLEKTNAISEQNLLQAALVPCQA